MLPNPDRVEQASDRVEQPSDRGEQPSDREGPPEPQDGSVTLFTLTPAQEHAIAGLGNRPRKDSLRTVIEQICADQWATSADLAQVLDISAAKLTERHLSPMVQEGRLKRRYPHQPTHAKQAYRAALRQYELPLGEEAADSR